MLTGKMPVIVLSAVSLACMSCADLVDEDYFCDASAVPVNLSFGLENALSPSIAIDSNDVVYVAWSSYIEQVGTVVFLANSTDWLMSRCIISDNSMRSERPVIAVDGNGVVHAVWEVFFADMNSSDIYYANSTDWAGTLVNVSGSTGYNINNELPSIAVNPSGIAHVAWNEEGDNIYYSCSINWNNKINISNGDYSSVTYCSIALLPDGDACVAWTETSSDHLSRRVCIAFSTDWAGTKTVVYTTDDFCLWPCITVDNNGIIHAVWTVFGPPAKRILYANSTDWNGTLAPVSPGCTMPVCRKIVSDSNNVVHISWREGLNDPHGVLYANSTDWKLSRRTMTRTAPEDIWTYLDDTSIAVDSECNAHIVWEHLYDYPGAAGCVYYRSHANK